MEITQALTQDEIAALKLKLGVKEIYELKVATDQEGEYAYGYLKKPNRPILSAVMNRIQSDPLGSVEMLLRNCLLEDVSDSRILEDDEMFLAAAQSANQLINIRASELKKN